MDIIKPLKQVNFGSAKNSVNSFVTDNSLKDDSNPQSRQAFSRPNLVGQSNIGYGKVPQLPRVSTPEPPFVMDEKEFQRVKYERYKQKKENKIKYYQPMEKKVKL